MNTGESIKREKTVTDQSRIRFPQFYITSPQPCPYLPGRYEKKVFTHLLGDEPVSLNNALTQAGFRRSQNIAYRPACDGCQACISVRVVADEFQPGRTFRRLISRNSDLRVTQEPARATDTQYALLRRYLDERHAEGGMADMSKLDYVAMVEDTTIETQLIEYRLGGDLETPGRLIAAALTDTLKDGLSMVYSFYEPGETARSLGTWMVLDHIERTRKLGLPYVYLGYWVEDSRKMTYKTRFQPLEALTPEGWRRMPETSS